MTIVLREMGRWQLCGRHNPVGPVEEFSIGPEPVRIGRSTGADLRITNPSVSNLHAEMFVDDDELWLRDLTSTNGSYVNGIPAKGLARIQLVMGDLVQFADVVFRVNRTDNGAPGSFPTVQSNAQDSALALVQFDRLMSQKAVVPHYQPIVSLPAQRVVGYEILGRSRHVGLEAPGAMFKAAAQINQEGALSELLRVVGIEQGESIDKDLPLFLNTHPVELVTPLLLDSLSDLRNEYPSTPLVLEVHEAAVTDNKMMAVLREHLTKLGIGLAYDDFGAGESRLVQLANECPNYVKFDMHMIRDIDRAPVLQRQLLETLVSMVHEFGTMSLAEGIETKEEHTVCCEIGFQFGQGYFYGMPIPRNEIELSI